MKRDTINRRGANRRRRGASATYIAVALPVIGGFGALAIEFAYLHLVHTQLQVVADAAAQAANMHINSNSQGLTDGVTAAQAVASGIKVNGQSYTLDANDIEYGKYNLNTGVWQAYPGVVSAAAVNAVRVTPTEPNVGLGFGQAFLGQTHPVGACGAVMQGPGNAGDDMTDTAGLRNGHFDFDTTDPRHSCSGITQNATCALSATNANIHGTTKHTHQYDNATNLTFANLFTPDVASGGGFPGVSGHLPINGCTKDSDGSTSTCGAGKTRPLADTQQFKIQVINADLSPGAWMMIGVNGGAAVRYDVTTWDDATLASTPTYQLGAGPPAGVQQLTSMSVNFNVDAIANCELMPTIWDDVLENLAGVHGEWRAGALVVQLVKPTATRTAGLSAGGQDVTQNAANGLLMENLYFWHWASTAACPLCGARYVSGNGTTYDAAFDSLDCHEPVFIDSVTGGGTVCP